MPEIDRILPEIKQLIANTTSLVATCQEIASDVKKLVELVIPKAKEEEK